MKNNNLNIQNTPTEFNQLIIENPYSTEID